MAELLSMQQIMNAVYDSTGTPALNVTLVEGAVSISAVTNPLSADSSSVSAIQEGANRLRVSSFEGGYAYNNISTSAQTVVKSGAGILGSVAVNVPTLTSAVRLYDNTVSGGTVIATLAAGVSCGSYPYFARFGTGLVVSSGAAADNVTIMYN